MFGKQAVRVTFGCLIACAAMLLSQHSRSTLRTLITRFRGLSRDVSTKSRNATIVFAIGTPSTDKDTFIGKLAEDYNFHQLILGSWLSALRERDDATGDLARHHWEKQIPMPADKIVPLLQAYISDIGGARNISRIIIDGFPRNREGAEVFAREIGSPDLVVYFETPKNRATEQYLRVVRDRFDSMSGKDEKKLVHQRFEEHEHEMAGLVGYLESQGRFIKVCSLSSSLI